MPRLLRSVILVFFLFHFTVYVASPLGLTESHSAHYDGALLHESERSPTINILFLEVMMSEFFQAADELPCTRGVAFLMKKKGVLPASVPQQFTVGAHQAWASLTSPSLRPEPTRGHGAPRARLTLQSGFHLLVSGLSPPVS
ncbi:MAG: hypothetical protein ACM3ON_12310 [Chloroflexota bacterium]